MKRTPENVNRKYTQEEMDQMERDYCICPPYPNYRYQLGLEHEETCVRINKGVEIGFGPIPTDEPNRETLKKIHGNCVLVYKLRSKKLVWRFQPPE